MTYKTLTINLPHQEKVAVHIGHSITEQALNTLELNSKHTFIITQEELISSHVKPILNCLTQRHKKTHIITVPNGEEAKSIDTFSNCLNQIFEIGVERSDTIISIGGGVVTDLAGFIASSCLRGLNLVHIPTTLLAQIDAAIGGKTGINHTSGKNLIGAFYQPTAIIIDTNALTTLPRTEFKSGFAEIIKTALIKDQNLYDTLLSEAPKLSKFNIINDMNLWIDIISKTCSHKIDVVTKDEKEAGLRAILNFGHTIGHGIEAFFNYSTYKHGECVIFGMCAATHIAENRGLLNSNLAQNIYDLIKAYDYNKLHLKPFTLEDILPILKRDKKTKHDTLTFILPTTIGNVSIVSDVSNQEIEKSIYHIHTIFNGEIK